MCPGRIGQRREPGRMDEREPPLGWQALVLVALGWLLAMCCWLEMAARLGQH